MLESLELENFQSHRSTILEFDPGVNAIIGISNHGKTAILRGLYWARNNQPAGDSFVSKWARDKKGKQVEQTNVIVIKDGISLIRGKGPDLNGYQIGTQKFEALGKGGLPEEVSQFFNTSEVNIQEQMDSPFLIGTSSAEIARFLNKIVDMSDIEIYLSAIESKKRANVKDIKFIKKEISNTWEALKKFDSLDNLELRLSKLEKVSNRIAIKRDNIQAIRDSMTLHTKLTSKTDIWVNMRALEGLLVDVSLVIKSMGVKKGYLTDINPQLETYKDRKEFLAKDPTATIDAVIKKIGPIIKEKRKLQKVKKSLAQKLWSYQEQRAYLKEEVDLFSKIEVLIKEIIPITKKRNALQIVKKELKKSREAFQRQAVIKWYCDQEIPKLETELPETCPLCGNPFKGGTHEKH